MKKRIIWSAIYLSIFLVISCNSDNERTDVDDESADMNSNAEPDEEELMDEDDVSMNDTQITDDDNSDGKTFDEDADTDVVEEDAPLEGIYSVSGSDEKWGDYTGRAEIRKEEGAYVIYHTQVWNNSDFEGDKVALAWEGDSVTGAEPYVFNMKLGQVGFITTYNEFNRDNKVLAPPLEYSANFTRTFPDTIEGVFTSSDGDIKFDEKWVWEEENGEEPIWQNMRQLIPGHEPPTELEKAGYMTTYSTFHSLDILQPYVDDPMFNEWIHYWVFDPTDFEFYRDNPDIIRVIQKIPDEISLVEARIRNRAYRQTLKEKTVRFDEMMSYKNDSKLVNDAGMMIYENGRYDCDSLEWTGVYVASQALRYMATGEQDALDNMIHSLDGIILTYNIAPTPGDFARTVRPHQEPVGDGWVAGQGEYAEWDWLTPANNDMIKGYFIGFTFAYLALKNVSGYDNYKQQMIDIINGLMENKELMPQLEDVIEVQRIKNTLVGVAMLLMMMPDSDFIEKGKLYSKYSAMYTETKQYIVDNGNGSTYTHGVSDWSGNQLNMETLLVLKVIAKELEGSAIVLDNHLNDFEEGMRTGLARLSYTRLGLYQLVYATLGAFTDVRPEVEDSLWVLREFASPKEYFDIDWRINPEFVMSPSPNLPWKNDWVESDDHRTQSLIAYPLFERNPDNYQWKVMPTTYTGSGNSVMSHMSDYLIAYWFGRYYGVIDENM